MKKFNYKYDDLYNAVLNALHTLGGSASNSEIEDSVIEFLNLSDDEINDIHRGTVTKLTYRLAWARNYLKHYGLLMNSKRGIWALTSTGIDIKNVNKEEVNKKVKSYKKEQNKKDNSKPNLQINSNEEENDDNDLDWKEELLNTIKDISPDAFERLCQRLLRELGFVNVKVTGKPNDGGIDGKGILRLGGILSFHVVFQAKRYKDIVSPNTIRDFRGSMSANVDKGLVITTGRFTKEARKEAQRDGAVPIDLIDGNELVEKLKELNMGINIKLVEKVSIDTTWYKEI